MYSRRRINTKRQIEFDLLKACAVAFMILIHVYEEMYHPAEALPATIWENLLGFVGGPLAAPVFMFALGVGIVYSKHNGPKPLFFRGLRIFILAYVLNFARSVLPYLIVCPKAEFDYDVFYYLFFNVDILHFAGITFMVTALFKKLKLDINLIFLIALLMQVVGIILDAHFDQFAETVPGYFLGLIFYTGYGVCFPFLLWYVYPTLGILFARFLTHINDPDRFYLKTFIVSSVLLIVFCCTLYFIDFDFRQLYTIYEDFYYRQTFLHVIFIILVILVVSSIAHFLHKWFYFKAVDNVIRITSANLNVIYIIQWLIIGWLDVAFMIDIHHNAWLILLVGIAVIMESIPLSILYNCIAEEIRKRIKARTKKA